jgi:hypothetical protein
LESWIRIRIKVKKAGSGSIVDPHQSEKVEAFKGTVSRDFLLLVFFMNQFPPSPRVSHLDRFEFFRKFRKFATGVNDTGGKFAAGNNDTGGNLPPVSTTPAANLPPVSMTPVANDGNIIRLLIP